MLYLGRLNAKKGLDVLIQAVARVARHVPDVRLAIAGAGDPPAFAEKVQRWLSESGLSERAVMTGLLTHDEKRSAFADADVFMLPSHAENFAFAMFEAMASRLPVIVAESLNFAAQVAAYGAGLVVPRTVEAFAAAIEAVLDDVPCNSDWAPTVCVSRNRTDGAGPAS